MKTDNKIDLSKRTKGEYKVSSFLDIYANDTAIGACYVGRLPDEECEANAAYIVLAVNNFDKLTEALSELMRFDNLFKYVAPELQYPDNFLNAVNNAKEILKSIKQQQ